YMERKTDLWILWTARSSDHTTRSQTRNTREAETRDWERMNEQISSTPGQDLTASFLKQSRQNLRIVGGIDGVATQS
ncbi:MAG TPA: hypothetical protein VF742_01545, partial [Terracidiphilus sp.]